MSIGRTEDISYYKLGDGVHTLMMVITLHITGYDNHSHGSNVTY